MRIRIYYPLFPFLFLLFFLCSSGLQAFSGEPQASSGEPQTFSGVLQDLETESLVEIRGVKEARDGGYFVVDEKSSSIFAVKGFEDTEGEFRGIFRLLENEEGKLVPTIVKENQLPTAAEILSLPRASQFPGTRTKVKGSESSWSEYFFPSSVDRAAQRFLKKFGEYRSSALSVFFAELRKKGIKSGSTAYSVITKANEKAHRSNERAYDEAIAACDDYIELCRSEGIWKGIDNEASYLDMDKRSGLLRVVDKSSELTLLCVPFAYGANPDGANKQRSGDLRTPDLPESLCNPEASPYYVGRRSRGTVAPGMTTRCMGISSSRGKDKFWVSHGMNIAIHGTPAKWSMGLRASHGCCRVLDKHIIHVYNLTAVGTKIIIRRIAENPFGDLQIKVGSTARVNVSTSLNVRSGPSTGHNKIGSLRGGEEVLVVDTRKGWYKVETSSVRGWVSGDYLLP